MDLYSLLGVARDAGRDVIRKAFRRKAKDVHPDVGGDVVAFTQLLLAHDVLVDPERREAYDKNGNTEPPQPEDYLRQVALALLGELLQVILTVDADLDPNQNNLVELGVEHLGKAIKKLEQQLAAVALAQQRANVMKNRWRPKQSETNILGKILDSQKDQLAQSEANIRGHIKAHQLAIEILEDHQFAYEMTNGSVVVAGTKFYQARG